MQYILAVLFIGSLVFAYFQAKLFVGMIRSLVQVISDLKSFSLGKPEEAITKPLISIPSHPDFGLGEIEKEIDKAENEEEI